MNVVLGLALICFAINHNFSGEAQNSFNIKPIDSAVKINGIEPSHNPLAQISSGQSNQNLINGKQERNLNA